MDIIGGDKVPDFILETDECGVRKGAIDMRRMRSITALLLSFLMILSTQGMTVFAESRTAQAEHISETVSLNSMEESAKKPERISGKMMLELDRKQGRLGEILPLQKIDPAEPSEAAERQNSSTFHMETAIYWNPGGTLPGEITASSSNAAEYDSVYESAATLSNAIKETNTYLFDRLIPATSSNAAKGNDRADGLSPERPVKSLETAMLRADELAEEYGVDKSEITIYAMSPMEVKDGHMYVLNAGGIRIASWDGRRYVNDTIFYLNGGQLTLVNVTLESGRDEADGDEIQLVRVDGGALQLGSGVQLDGRIVMDYRQSKEEPDWETATGSEAKEKATASSWMKEGESRPGFSINDYIFSDQEGEWELLEDTIDGSTWREPIIELIEGFEGLGGGYLLEIRGDADLAEVTLAKTLYADAVSNEDFESFFEISGFSGGQWSLSSTSEKAGMVHDTGAADLERFYADIRRVKKSRSTSALSLEDHNEGENDRVSEASGSLVTVKRLTATRAARAGGAVYWDPVNGNDNNSGLTTNLPVKSLIRANTVLRSSSNLTTLYLKNTATVSVGVTWDLPAGKELVADPSVWAGTGDPVLVRVINGGNLFLKNMTIRNNLDRQNNVSIMVTGTGKLTIQGSTILTGQSDTKDVTRVTQVRADSGATVLLHSDWTGSIENSSQGIVANVSGTTVTMNSGSIRRNNSYDPAATPEVLKYAGGGVSVRGGSTFTMNGGTISENKAWVRGSGVCVEGINSTFNMKGGFVSNNTVSGGNTYSTVSSVFYGVGIFGEDQTVINIDGRGSANPPVISGNKGYVGYGGAIFSNSRLTIYNAKIADNRADPTVNGTGNGKFDGVGVVISNKGTLYMENSQVTGNWLEGSGSGAGLWIESSYGRNHTIVDSVISDNRGGTNGGGIQQVNYTNLTITNSQILRNRSLYGAGIDISGAGGERTQLKVERCAIEENIATSSPASSGNPQPNYSGIGGIRVSRGKATIIDSSIMRNQGIGVRCSNRDTDQTSTPVIIRGTGTQQMKISENGGHGIYADEYQRVMVSNAEISRNSGRGITLTGNSRGYVKNVEIKNNTTTYEGAGVYTNSPSPSYFTDVKVEGNTTSAVGGGIYLNGGLYWTETAAGLSSLKGNKSQTQGGGIYKNGGSVAVLDFSSEIQNTAAQQGSNLYLRGGGLYLTKGKLLQPTVQTAGIYNVYADVAANSGSTYIDPSAGKVTIQKKSGVSPDAIFLNTPASALTYLQAPANNTPTLPIDLNPAGFSPGNIVIKPANVTQVSSWRVNVNETNGELNPVEYQIPYTALKNAGLNQGYSSGGRLPAGTRLIAKTTAGLTNVILDYEDFQAVYVDGVNGRDNNLGITPSAPVRSMKRAYELLNNYSKMYSEKIIFVVNTVTMNGSVTLDRAGYTGSDGIVLLSSAAAVNPSTVTVKLARYIQPDFARNGQIQDYNVGDFKGKLLEVAGGASLSLAEGVIVDGHSKPWTASGLKEELKVSREGEAEAPLIHVRENGRVQLASGSALQYNNNIFDSGAAQTGGAGLEGGAIHNCGTVTVNGTKFTENQAQKGGAAYQAGTFTIESGVSGLEGYSFYLASTGNGSGLTDHVLQIGEKIPAGMVNRFKIDMDHAAAGRDVIRFTDTSAYPNGADAEHGYFVLGSTVPNTLFLVESQENNSVLELQDWKILKVEVPKDIYLVVNRDNRDDSTTELKGIVTGQTEFLGSPEYKIKNTGMYDVRVSITGMDNANASAGITAYGDIELKDSAASAVGENDLYLGVKGMDTDAANGLTFGEQALLTQGMVAFELGRLTAGNAGTFMFTGKVGTGFMNKYRDMNFPITETDTEAKQHMDGTGDNGTVNARAKYLLKYKVEID